MSGLNSSGISPQTDAAGVASFASGYYTGDGSGSIEVGIGFTPVRVKVIDMTVPNTYEWQLGMAATDTLLCTGSSGVLTVDTNSLVTTNSTLVSTTQTGVYEPGSSGPGDGTLINTTVEIEQIDHTQPNLTLASGLNTSEHKYVWIAER